MLMRHYHQTVFRPAVAGYVAGFIILGILYVHEFGWEHFQPETIRDMILSLGNWGPLLYILCNVFRPFFFFPAMILAVAGGLAFGPLWGTLYLIAGTVLGAALCFGTARLLGANRIKPVWGKWMLLEELDNQAASHGFRTVLFLRLAPVLPWDAVSFLAGLSQVRFWPYMGATLLGSVPGAIAFSYFGHAMLQSAATAAALAVMILIMSFCLRLLRRVP